MTTQKRSLEVTGAVFWMIVFGIINVVSVIDYAVSFGFSGLAQIGIPVSIIFALLLFVAAYFGLKQRSWPFVISTILGAFVVIMTPVVDGFNGNIAVWDSFLLVGGFLTMYTGFLGLLKVRSSEHPA